MTVKLFLILSVLSLILYGLVALVFELKIYYRLLQNETIKQQLKISWTLAETKDQYSKHEYEALTNKLSNELTTIVDQEFTKPENQYFNESLVFLEQTKKWLIYASFVFLFLSFGTWVLH